MARLFPEDSPISVAADPYGVPVQVLLLDHWRVVAQICNRRRTVAAWWEPAAAAHREFFKIATTDGPVSPAPYYGAKFDGPGCEWPMLDIPVFKIGCLAGEYQALLKTASQSVWTTATNMAIHPDFDLVADVRFVGPSDGMAGLITDVTNNGEFYLFAVSKSGQYTLRAVSSSGWLALILWTPTTRFNLGASNRLMVRRQNGSLGIYLNGQLLSNSNAGRNAGQEVGVYNSATGQPNADIRWDNFGEYPVGSMPEDHDSVVCRGDAGRRRGACRRLACSATQGEGVSYETQRPAPPCGGAGRSVGAVHHEWQEKGTQEPAATRRLPQPPDRAATASPAGGSEGQVARPACHLHARNSSTSLLKSAARSIIAACPHLS